MSDVPPPTPTVAVQAQSVGEFTYRDVATSDGPRRYKLYVPKSYSKSRPAPLLVVLHGCTQDPDDIARGTLFNSLAEEKGILVAYPEQPQKANGLKCWNWFDTAHQRRDKGEPALIADITRQVIANYRVDSRRVYIAGVSAGGAMALTVAYAYPDLYAAAGIHSGIAYGAAGSIGEAIKAMASGVSAPDSLASAVVKGMGSRRWFPAIFFQGGADKSVKVVNVGQAVAQLSELHSPGGLTRRPATARISEGGYHYSKTTFGKGKPLIEEWVIDELGHAWSGGSNDGTYTDAKGPNASREMLRFFLEHPRRK